MSSLSAEQDNREAGGYAKRIGLTDRFLYKDRKPFISEVEYEFGKIFSVCKSCGFVTPRDKKTRRGAVCVKSASENIRRKRKKEYQATKDYLKKDS